MANGRSGMSERRQKVEYTQLVQGGGQLVVGGGGGHVASPPEPAYSLTAPQCKQVSMVQATSHCCVEKCEPLVCWGQQHASYCCAAAVLPPHKTYCCGVRVTIMSIFIPSSYVHVRSYSFMLVIVGIDRCSSRLLSTY